MLHPIDLLSAKPNGRAKGLPRIWQLALGLTTSLAAVGGCGSAMVEKPVVQTLATTQPAATQPSDADATEAVASIDVDFWHLLAAQPITSNDDAFHALLLFADGDDPAADFAGRAEALKQKGWLSSGFDRSAEQAVDRGTLAVALAKALDIKGGAIMRLFGPSPRYATKELEYLAVYPTSSPNQTLSGSEFLAVMSRVEEYERQRDEKSPTGGPAYVPPEMEVRREPLAPALPAPDAVPAEPTTPDLAPADAVPAVPSSGTPGEG